MVEHGERIAVLETQVAAMQKQVSEIHEVVVQLKGAKYASWLIFAAIGYFLHTLFPFFPKGP